MISSAVGTCPRISVAAAQQSSTTCRRVNGASGGTIKCMVKSLRSLASTMSHVPRFTCATRSATKPLRLMPITALHNHSSCRLARSSAGWSLSNKPGARVFTSLVSRTLISWFIGFGPLLPRNFSVRNRRVVVEMLAPQPTQQRRQHVFRPLAILLEARIDQLVGLRRRNQTEAPQVTWCFVWLMMPHEHRHKIDLQLAAELGRGDVLRDRVHRLQSQCAELVAHRVVHGRIVAGPRT